MTREAGKGDTPRKGADQEAYSAGWDRIFKKNKEIEFHTCPRKEKILQDSDSLCDCSPEEMRKCVVNI